MLLLLLKVQGQRGDDWDIEKVMEDKEFEEVTDLPEVKEVTEVTDLTKVKEVTEVVLYCDRVVQLENRTDESQETCRSAYRRGAGSYFGPSRLERVRWGHYHSAEPISAVQAEITATIRMLYNV